MEQVTELHRAWLASSVRRGQGGHKRHDLAILLITVSQALRPVCGMQWALNKHMWKGLSSPSSRSRLGSKPLIWCLVRDVEKHQTYLMSPVLDGMPGCCSECAKSLVNRQEG